MNAHETGMAGHVVFVDTNAPGLQAIDRAQQRGLKTVLLVSRTYQHLYAKFPHEHLFERAVEVIQIDDSSDPEQVRVALIALAKRVRVDALVCVAHWSVLGAAIAAKEIGVPFTSATGIRNSTNKTRTRELMSQSGLRSVRYGSFDAEDIGTAKSFCRTLGYPVIAKPARGGASIFAAVIENDAQLTDHMKRFTEFLRSDSSYVRILEGDVLIEERIEGKMFSVEIGLTVQGDWLLLMVDERKRVCDNEVLDLGTTVPARLSRSLQDEMVEYSKQIINVVGLDMGIFHLEFIVQDGVPYLIEVNPRLMGGALTEVFRLATGVNVFDLLIDVHLGHEIETLSFPLINPIASRAISPCRDGIVDPDLSPDWADVILPRLVHSEMRVVPGADYVEVTGNFGTLGSIYTTGVDADDATDRVEVILREIEDKTRIPLMH